MAKPRKQDFAQNALRVVEQSIAAPLSTKIPDADSASKEEVSRFMTAMGRRGGLKGGKNRWNGMTPEQRSQAASAAANARWGKETAKD